MKFNPTVPLLYYKKTNVYVPGEGQTAVWTSVISNALFCEWTGGYGDRAIAAQAQGVNEMATVRTFYHPDVLAALKLSTVVVIKNADATAIVSGVPDASNPNTYQLWGGVDNVNEENRYMEFKVRRYENK